MQTIASQSHINIQDLIDGVLVPKPNLADKLDDVQKHNILCIFDIYIISLLEVQNCSQKICNTNDQCWQFKYGT